MPILALGGGYIPVFGGNITMPSIAYRVKIVAQNVQTIIVPNSGHWIAEEQPVLLVTLLSNFFSGNRTTTTSKWKLAHNLATKTHGTKTSKRLLKQTRRNNGQK